MATHTGPLPNVPISKQRSDIAKCRGKVRKALRNDWEIVYMDECSFSPNRLGHLRTYARAGQPLRKAATWVSKPYIAIVAAISKERGYICGRARVGGAFDGPDILEFLKDLVRHMDGRRRWAIFMDNARIHTTPENKRYLRQNKVFVIPGVVRRPDFNGIEMFWNYAKREYRSLLFNYLARGEDWTQEYVV